MNTSAKLTLQLIKTRLRRFMNWIDPIILMLVLGPLMIVFAWWTTLHWVELSRQRATAEAYRSAISMSRVFGDQSVRRLETVDRVIRAVRLRYLNVGASIDLRDLMADIGYDSADYQRIHIVGPDGEVVATSGPDAPTNMRDREYFTAHINRKDDFLYIGQPSRSTSTGRYTLQVTRRIDLPDHSFGGVVMVSLAPDYFLPTVSKSDLGPFRQSINNTDLGPQDMVGIIGLDGVVRVTLMGGVPVDNIDVTGNAAVQHALATGYGPSTATNTLDGVERIWSGGQLAEYPLVVAVGLATDRTMAEFHRQREVILLGTTWFSVGILVLTLLASWLAARQRRMLRRLAASERQSNEFKTSFTAKISHDLRTPLNGIIGFADMIRATAKEAELRQYAQFILNSANHLSALVNTILDMTKLRASKLNLQLAAADLRETATQVAQTHSLVAKNKNLLFDLVIDEAFPASVMCDAVRVRQILNNLLHNAIKFTTQGTIRLALTADETNVYLKVSDTGIGMSADVKSHLFEFFREGRDEAARPNVGSGLGLAFSQELVKLHGGSIRVQSVVDVGTRMIVCLPILGPNAAKPST